MMGSCPEWFRAVCLGALGGAFFVLLFALALV